LKGGKVVDGDVRRDRSRFRRLRSARGRDVFGECVKLELDEEGPQSVAVWLRNAHFLEIERHVDVIPDGNELLAHPSRVGLFEKGLPWPLLRNLRDVSENVIE